MGVLACDRKGCENIMCDYYVPEVGYICYECKDEFTAFLQYHEFRGTTLDDCFISGLEMFIDTPKGKWTLSKHPQRLELFWTEHQR